MLLSTWFVSSVAVFSDRMDVKATATLLGGGKGERERERDTDTDTDIFN